MTGSTPPQASKEGWDLAQLADDLPDPVARHLFSMLGNSLASIIGPAVRARRLRLIIELVDETGLVPSYDEYQEARQLRPEDDFEDASTLIGHYGSWTRAVRAAFEMWHIGAASRTPATLDHQRNMRQYTNEYSVKECEEAMIRFFERFGDWPGEWEYLEWAALERRLARHAGQPYPRLPTRKALKRNAGDDWDEFIRSCERRHASATS